MLRTVLLLSALNVGGVALRSDLSPQRAACSILTLQEVRTIVGAPVNVFAEASFPPKKEDETTISTCTYATGGPKNRGARVILMWGTSAHLADINGYYAKRNKEIAKIRGDMLVLASVMDTSPAGFTDDRPATEKLLAAVLAKLTP